MMSKCSVSYAIFTQPLINDKIVFEIDDSGAKIQIHKSLVLNSKKKRTCDFDWCLTSTLLKKYLLHEYDG